MKDCAQGDTPIVKGDKFSLNQYSKNEMERKQMQNSLYAYAMGNLIMLKYLHVRI